MKRSSTRSYLFVRLLAPLTIVVAGMLSPSVSTASRSNARSDVDTSAIEQVVTQAMVAKDTLFIVANPAGGVALTQADLQTAQTRASAVLNTLYSPTSPRLATFARLVQRGLDGERSGDFRVMNGGIRDVVFDSIAIAGATATVELTFTNWARYAVRQPDGSIVYAEPSNKMIEHVNLVKTDQGWRIIDDTANFAPGSEP